MTAKTTTDLQWDEAHYQWQERQRRRSEDELLRQSQREALAKAGEAEGRYLKADPSGIGVFPFALIALATYLSLIFSVLGAPLALYFKLWALPTALGLGARYRNRRDSTARLPSARVLEAGARSGAG